MPPRIKFAVFPPGLGLCQFQRCCSNHLLQTDFRVCHSLPANMCQTLLVRCEVAVVHTVFLVHISMCLTSVSLDQTIHVCLQSSYNRTILWNECSLHRHSATSIGFLRCTLVKHIQLFCALQSRPPKSGIQFPDAVM